MTYPQSKEVHAGETTLASQYNALRDDAVYLGGSPAANGTLGQLLAAQHTPLRFTVTQNSITLNASTAEPAALCISRLPAVNTAPVTLTLTAQEFPNKAILWLFAQKEPSAAGFTLSARTADAENEGLRRIGRFLWHPEPPSITYFHGIDEWALLNALQEPDVCQGRLTLTANTPFPTADINAAGTLYFTPCFGNKIALYDALAGWQTVSFQQLSVALSGKPADRCYDAFVSLDSAGKAQLTLEEWSNLTTRAQSLSWLDGVPVLTNTPERRYVGTIGLSATGMTRDTLAERLVWNLYHPVGRPLRKLCAVAQNTNPASGVWVPYARDNALAVTVVLGLNHAELQLTGIGAISTLTSNASALGIGIDIDLSDFSLNLNAAELCAFEYKAGALFTRLTNRIANRMLGKHAYHLITYTSNDTHTFNGTVIPQNLCGLSGVVMG